MKSMMVQIQRSGKPHLSTTPQLSHTCFTSRSLPQIVYPETDLLSRRYWRHSQVLANHFWSSFLRNYLPSLQMRQNWHSTRGTEGTVVMLVDSQLPRASWPVGNVAKVHPSADGHIRSADVRIGEHHYTRPVARLVALPALPAGKDDPATKTKLP
ncbi:uncharacterized protein [Syngnathus scovelli]|uniref:uncharacterized protein isoform X3 n=1 Tax=Syngnathus scovelli TaxID=161590 RepID=UPI0035CA708B